MIYHPLLCVFFLHCLGVEDVLEAVPGYAEIKHDVVGPSARERADS